MIVPTYLPYYVITGAIGAIAAILFGMRSALRNAHWTTEDRTSTVRAAAIIVIGWFLLAIALALVDAYRGTADRIPTIQYGILVPILIGGLLIWRSPRVARIIDAVPPALVCWGSALSYARRDFPDPLCGGQAAWIVRLAGWPWRCPCWRSRAGRRDCVPAWAARECRSGLRVEPIWACRFRGRGDGGIFNLPFAVPVIRLRSAERAR
jgi:hypothetical protein